MRGKSNTIGVLGAVWSLISFFVLAPVSFLFFFVFWTALLFFIALAGLASLLLLPFSFVFFGEPILSNMLWNYSLEVSSKYSFGLGDLVDWIEDRTLN